jgi:DMSO/TMAO reductase YedYZ heme-binding membrane subunit
MAREPKRTWVLIAGVGGSALLVTIWILINGYFGVLHAVIRGTALLGYLLIFMTSLGSLYKRELTRYFGRSFIGVHHIFSIGGLALLTLHGLGVAWQSRSLAAILPDFSSLTGFLRLGGRPALWIFAVTTLTALYRSALRKQWRQIHWLNYLAFVLGTVHGIWIGTDLQALIARIVVGVMGAVVAAAFVWQRIERRRRIRRAREKAAAARRKQQED